MVGVVKIVHNDAVVMVIVVSVVAAGASHGLLCSSNCQLTETPVQTGLASLWAVRASLQSPQAWGQRTQNDFFKIKFDSPELGRYAVLALLNFTTWYAITNFYQDFSRAVSHGCSTYNVGMGHIPPTLCVSVPSVPNTF